jgi:putative ABC transport system substrate-binding protein
VAAQPAPTVRRIGLLSNGTATTTSPQLDAFRRGLRERGWVEGQTVAIEYRWAEGNADRIPTLFADLVRARVDVIVLSGSPALRTARAATTTIPVAFLLLADPVSAGFVSSLARPGGNMTGVASEFEELITKQLQLLREALPRASRVALLYQAQIVTGVLPAAEAAAAKLGFTTRALKVADASELETVVRSARGEGVLLVFPSPFFNTHRHQLIELAARYRLPAIYEFKNYVDERDVPGAGRLRRSHPQGRETRRAADPAADDLRARHQPQGGRRAGPDTPAVAAGAGRPRDPMTLARKRP